jgi:hypothetical protein
VDCQAIAVHAAQSAFKGANSSQIGCCPIRVVKIISPIPDQEMMERTQPAMRGRQPAIAIEQNWHIFPMRSQQIARSFSSLVSIRDRGLASEEPVSFA